MTQLISNVFKIIMIAVIIGFLYSVVLTVSDVFMVTTQVQEVAEYVKTDIAKNNCMLNSTYNYAMVELGKCTNSSYCFYLYGTEKDKEAAQITVGANTFTFNDHIRPNGYLSSKGTMELTTNLTMDSTSIATRQKYMQLDATDTGVAVMTADNVTALGDTRFAVAHYGTIMNFSINCAITPKLMFFSDGSGFLTSTEDANLDTISWFVFNPIDVTLGYSIPALTYIK